MDYQILVPAHIVAEHLADPAWVVFDCRFDLADPDSGYRAYRDAHIPGARYAHLDRDLAAPQASDTGRHPLPDPDAFAAWLGRQGVAAGTQVVAYDQGPGAFAARLWWMLRWLGHRSAAVLDGGWRAWAEAGLPASAEAAEPDAQHFRPHADPRAWVSSVEVLARMRACRGQLLDARAEPRFAGREEPIDPVAGHVPGALNLPFDGNLDEAGHFKAAARLRERFAAIIGDTPANEVVHMCGSGVTACHNALAMEAAGLTGSRVYAGSWSEWISDPSRPIATET